MILRQSMGDAILRSIPQKGIYHFDVILQHMSDTTMQNVLVGTVIVKIKGDKISTYEYSCNYIKRELGYVAIMSIAKEIAIKQAQEIEKFITD